MGPPSSQGPSAEASNLSTKSEVMELMSRLTCSLSRSPCCGRWDLLLSALLGRPRIGATHVRSSAETYGTGAVGFMLGSKQASRQSVLRQGVQATLKGGSRRLVIPSG